MPFRGTQGMSYIFQWQGGNWAIPSMPLRKVKHACLSINYYSTSLDQEFSDKDNKTMGLWRFKSSVLLPTKKNVLNHKFKIQDMSNDLTLRFAF